MKHLLSTLAALSLLACEATTVPHYTLHAPVATPQPSRVIPVAIDKQFSPAEEREIEAALQEWNYAFNGQLRFTIYTKAFEMQDSTISYIYNSKGLMLLSVSKLGNVMMNLDDGTVAITSHVGTGHENLLPERESGCGADEEGGPSRIRPRSWRLPFRDWFDAACL